MVSTVVFGGTLTDFARKQSFNSLVVNVASLSQEEVSNKY